MLRGLGFCPPAPPPPPPPGPPEVPVIEILTREPRLRVTFNATTSTHSETYERFLSVPEGANDLEITAAILLALNA
jgi:hypothetical protein